MPPAATDIEAGGGGAAAKLPPHANGDDGDDGAAEARRVAAARYAEPYPSQLLLLLHRAFTSQCRNMAYNGTRFAVALGLALLLGSLYWNRGTKRWEAREGGKGGCGDEDSFAVGNPARAQGAEHEQGALAVEWNLKLMGLSGPLALLCTHTT